MHDDGLPVLVGIQTQRSIVPLDLLPALWTHRYASAMRVLKLSVFLNHDERVTFDFLMTHQAFHIHMYSYAWPPTANFTILRIMRRSRQLIAVIVSTLLLIALVMMVASSA
jgi:hypothetical protein